MKSLPAKSIVVFLAPALLGGVAAALPLHPPAKMWLATGLVAFLAFVFLCLTFYDLVVRAPYRPAIPLVWLTLAIGFGCLSRSLELMAQTWGLRLAQLPTAQVGAWFGMSLLLVLVGVVGFWQACQKRAQMESSWVAGSACVEDGRVLRKIQ